MSGIAYGPYPTYLTPAAVSTASSGATALVAASTGQKVRVYRMKLVSTSANTITFQDGSTGLTGPMAVAANQTLDFNHNGDPWFTTSSGNAFNMSLGNAAQVSGVVYYTQTPSPPN